MERSRQRLTNVMSANFRPTRFASCHHSPSLVFSASWLTCLVTEVCHWHSTGHSEQLSVCWMQGMVCL